MFLIPIILTVWKVHLYPFLPEQCNELLGCDKCYSEEIMPYLYQSVDPWLLGIDKNKHLLFLFSFTFK